MAELCRRCGAEIVTANLMDIDPGVDRAHFALVLSGNRRRQLSPTEWRLFAALYGRHGRVVSNVELGRAARIDRAGVIFLDTGDTRNGGPGEVERISHYRIAAARSSPAVG